MAQATWHRYFINTLLNLNVSPCFQPPSNSYILHQTYPHLGLPESQEKQFPPPQPNLSTSSGVASFALFHLSPGKVVPTTTTQSEHILGCGLLHSVSSFTRPSTTFEFQTVVEITSLYPFSLLLICSLVFLCKNFVRSPGREKATIITESAILG